MKNINQRVFDTCFELWVSRHKMLNLRERLKRYTYGDQWGDSILTPEGETISESEWIMRTGRRPLTNNLIRRLVKTIVGRYRDMAVRNSWYDPESAAGASGLLLEELDSRLLEEFVISGMAVQRVADDNPLNGLSADVTNVNPALFFCNDYRDPRGRDIETLGMLHDMSPAEAVMRFGKAGNGEFHENLDRLLDGDIGQRVPITSDTATFYTPLRGRIRIIEAWTREYGTSKGIEWRVRWFTPEGTMLASYTSPWGHRSHPFVVKHYPLTDGEVHSFVEDIVDQQKYINRIIVLIDRILATSSKGVLLFPTHQKPANQSWDQIAEQWGRPDGIIPITGKDEIVPRQIGGTTADASAYRLLEMELKLFDQTAGVGSALLGVSGANIGATGVDHYQAQVENATIALADIYRTFRSLIETRNRKLIALSD